MLLSPTRSRDRTLYLPCRLDLRRLYHHARWVARCAHGGLVVVVPVSSPQFRLPSKN